MSLLSSFADFLGNVLSGNTHDHHLNNTSTNKFDIHTHTNVVLDKEGVRRSGASKRNSSNARQGNGKKSITVQVHPFAFGAKGRFQTKEIHQTMVKQFGIEVKLGNKTNRTQNVNIGCCMFNKHDQSVFENNWGHCVRWACYGFCRLCRISMVLSVV